MKILERAVHDQLHDFLTENNILAVQQSGFRKAHSTNTVLCYVTDLLYKQMDCGQLTGVVFLDLKKAFDTVDHNLLLSKLSLFGITDIRVNWGKWNSGVTGTRTIYWPQSRIKSGNILPSVPLIPTPYVCFRFIPKLGYLRMN